MDYYPMNDDDLLDATAIALAGANGAAPDGFSNTSPRAAWFSVVAGALAYGDVAWIGRVNGGGVSAVVIARQDPAERSRMLLMTAASSFDPESTVPALETLARSKANARGKTLVRRRVVTTIHYDPV
jgi:hypothetical protein